MDAKIRTHRLEASGGRSLWRWVTRAGTLRRAVAWVLVMALVGLTVQPAFALPQDPNVWHHDAQAPTFDWDVPGHLTIEQFGDWLGIDWQSFSIGEGETVTFLQPNEWSVAINRVIGHDPSHIFGNLSADGQVFLLNPHGVLFAESAHVDVGALLASTLWMDEDQDRIINPWSTDPYTLYKKGETAGAVENFGSITAAQWGSVFLIGPEVRNAGEITTTRGTVGLAAGDKVSLASLIGGGPDLVIEGAALNALVENQQGAIIEGELVILSAEATESLTRSVINQDGIVHAYEMKRDDSGASDGGKIILSGGDSGTVHVGGRLDTEGSGGEIEISGKEIRMTTESDDPVTIHTEEIIIAANERIVVDAPVVFDHALQTDAIAILDAPRIEINGDMIRASSRHDLYMEMRNSTDQPSAITSTAGSELDVYNLAIHGTTGSIDLRGVVRTGAMRDMELYFADGLSQLVIRNAANRIGGLAFGSSASPLVVTGSGDSVDIRTGGRPLTISGRLVADGNVTIWNEGADLTLFSDTTSLEVHGLLTLAATDGGVFRNLVGPDALGGDGRKRIYSTQDADGFDDGGLGYEERRDVSYGEDPLADDEGGPNVIYFLDPDGAPVLIIELVPTEIVYGDLTSDYTFEVKYYLFTDPEEEYDPDLHDNDYLWFQLFDEQGKEIGSNEWSRLGVGEYGLGALGGFENYRLQYRPSALSIMRRDLTINLGNANRYYGEEDNVTRFVDVTYDGLTTFDTAAMQGMDNWTYRTPTTSATRESGAGEYAIVMGYMDERYEEVLKNYNVTIVEGTLTVRPRPLSIDIGDLSRVYGDDNDLSGVTLTPQPSDGQSGLTFDHTLADLGLADPASFLETDAQAQPASPVGTYGIYTNSDAMQRALTDLAKNYDITVNPGVLEITRRPVTITAHDLTRYYLDPNNFTYTISDLGYGHEPEFWFSPLPHEWNLDAGQYDIQPIVALDDREQYDFTLENGTLIVLPRPIEIDVHDVERQYGQDVDFWFNASTITGIPDDLRHFSPTIIYSTGDVTVRSDVGTYEGVVTASTDNPNYEIARMSPGTLEITPAPVWIDPIGVEKTYGDSVTLAHRYRGIMEWDDPDDVVYGVELYSEGAVETAETGSYHINVTAGDVYANGNYYLAGYGEALLVVHRRLLYPWLGDIEYHAGEPKPDHIIRFDNKAPFHTDEDIRNLGGDFILASRGSNFTCPGLPTPRCGASDQTGPWKWGVPEYGFIHRNYELVYDDPDQYGYETVLPPLTFDEIIDYVITNPRPRDISHPPATPPPAPEPEGPETGTEPANDPPQNRYLDDVSETIIIRLGEEEVEFTYEIIQDVTVITPDGQDLPVTTGPDGQELEYYVPGIENIADIPDECITWVGGAMHVDGGCMAWEEFPYTAGVPHESREILGQALGKWMQEMVLPSEEYLHLSPEEQEQYLRQRMNLTAANFEDLWDRLVAGDEELTAEVFPYLVAEFHAILEKDEADLTPGELAYVQHMAKVIQQERQTAAQMALDAYNKWRETEERKMEDRPNLINVFNPGAKPPDYLVGMAKHGFAPQDEDTGKRLAIMLTAIGGVGVTSLAGLGITSGIPGALTGLGKAIFPFAARAGTMIAQTISASAAIIGTVVSMGIILAFGIETLVQQLKVENEIHNALERAQHEPTFSELKEMMNSDEGQVELMLYQATALAKYGPGGAMERIAKGDPPLRLIVY